MLYAIILLRMVLLVSITMHVACGLMINNMTIDVSIDVSNSLGVTASIMIIVLFVCSIFD